MTVARSIEPSSGLVPFSNFGRHKLRTAWMVSRKSVEPSPASTARANRQRLAQEEGVRAMADVEQRAAAVRKNMERLRALRQASEAQRPAAEPASPTRKKKAKKAAIK
jgi:uncharacterized small protein (DUF1192 family)